MFLTARSSARCIYYYEIWSKGSKITVRIEKKNVTNLIRRVQHFNMATVQFHLLKWIYDLVFVDIDYFQPWLSADQSS